MATDGLGLAVALGAGLASFFAPCVLPVVPGYLAFVTGGRKAGRGKHAIRTLAFVAGFGVVFVLMGWLVGAATGSAAFRSFDTWTSRIGGAIIITFGLIMTGLLRVPSLEREARYTGQGPLRFGRTIGAALLGGAFAVGWSPCVGPIFASILVLAGVGGGGAAQGALLLTAYTIGLAIPFIVLGLTAEKGAAFLQRFSGATVWVERVGGMILIVLGIFVFTGSLARFTSYIG